MALTQNITMGTKFGLIKSQSDALLTSLQAVVHEEVGAAEHSGEGDIRNTRFTEINDVLDSVLNFLTEKHTQTQNLKARFSDDSAFQSQNLTKTTPEPQTVLPSNNTRDSDISKVVFTSEEQNLIMATRVSTIEQKIAQLEKVYEDRTETMGETLNSCMAYKLDSLDSHLQEILDKLVAKNGHHGFEMCDLKEQLQVQFRDLQHLKSNTTELMSRLFSIEQTTIQFITLMEKKEKNTTTDLPGAKVPKLNL